MDIQDRLKAYVSSEMDYWDFYGVIRIVKKGETIFEISRGEANLEFGIKNNMNTCFSVGSVTKQFTAFAIMLLNDMGLLSLDEKANHYLPSNMQIPSDISVHNLLSHTSGLYNYYNFEDDFYVCEDRLPYDKDIFFKKWINKKPVTPPNERFNYNNSNYNLLAWIIENVSGERFCDFVREKVFKPLGMQSSGFDNGQDIIKNMARGYMRDYGVWVRTPYVNNQFHIGAGTLVTNCDDLQLWYQCLRERKLLSEKAYQLYFRENKNNYCYGLEHHIQKGRVKYAHGGDAMGSAAYTQYFFEDDICIIILSNNESLNQYRFGNAIAEILFGEQPKSSRRPKEVFVSEHELRKFTGTYLPVKINIEVKNKKLYLVRVNQNIHIELYCVGENSFMRRYEEQLSPYILLQEGSTIPSIWGFELMSRQYL